MSEQEYYSESDKKHTGRQSNHQMKPYLIYQYLLHYTDENHTASASALCEYLKENGIFAERRSIYRDIKEINIATLMAFDDLSLEEARIELENDDYDEVKTIVYDKHSKGFYVRRRACEPDDVRLLAECVYTAKFIEEKTSSRLLNVLCNLVSEHQATRIQHSAFLTGRVKTENTSVFYNVLTINDAMSTRLNGTAHIPEKISFKYQTHTINDISKRVDRRHGTPYVVSPYELIINDGNYYLLAYSDKYRKPRTYRVDRMKDIQLTGAPRAGAEDMKQIDMDSYTKRVFGMYSGERHIITLRFINSLLDTAIERFGKQGVSYSKVDENHFQVITPVEISDQFFGWLLGFGKKVKILDPEPVIEAFTAYLDKIRDMY